MAPKRTALGTSRRPAACNTELEKLAARLTQAYKDWNLLQGARVLNHSLNIIKYACTVSKKARVGEQSQPLALRVEDTVKHLFAVEPQASHVYHKFLHQQDTMEFHDGNCLCQDTSLGLAEYFGAFASFFDNKYTPIRAVQPSMLTNPKGLLACGPCQPMFLAFLLSPSAVFCKKRQVSASMEGAVLPISYSAFSLATLHTKLTGYTFFLTFSATNTNLSLSKGLVFGSLSWPDLTSLMHKLEDPRFTYTMPGETVYLAPGQPYLVLSPDIGLTYTIFVANPSIHIWDHTLKAYNSLLANIISKLPSQTHSCFQKVALQLEDKLETWKETLDGLPEQCTTDTVAKSKV